jgi:hypothetical protein
VQLQPLVDALKDSMLKHAVLHADETPVAMLKPGNKRTHRAYLLWAYAPGAFENLKTVVYDLMVNSAQQTRALTEDIKFKQAKIEALSFEVARLKQWRFGKSSESLDAQAQQGQLFDVKTEVLLVDEANAEDRAETEQRTPTQRKKTPKRQALPSQLCGLQSLVQRQNQRSRVLGPRQTKILRGTQTHAKRDSVRGAGENSAAVRH